MKKSKANKENTPKDIVTRPYVESAAVEAKAKPSPQKYRVKNLTSHYLNFDIPNFGSCYIAPHSMSRQEFGAGDLVGSQIVVSMRSREIKIVEV